MTVDLRAIRELYPFESRWLDLGGLRYHYLDEGSGEAVVMVHGNPTWSFYFRELAKALRGDYRVIVPDHIGCGLSDKPGDDLYSYRLERRAEDLGALLEHLGLRENLTLVLHDWGGMIALAAVRKRPECVKRLVILNTSGFLMPAGKTFPWRLWMARSTGAVGAVAVRGCNAFSRLATRMAVVRPMSDEVRAAYTAPYDSWKNRIATLRFVQDIPLRAGDPSYAVVRSVDENLHVYRNTPTLICWGERDFVFDHHFLEEWKRRMPQAEVHSFADAGHYVLEDAGERIVPLVREFLGRHPVRRGGAAGGSEGIAAIGRSYTRTGGME